MTYEPVSQRLRSTLLQRDEQNGKLARSDGLPHSGHGRLGRKGATLLASAVIRHPRSTSYNEPYSPQQS